MHIGAVLRNSLIYRFRQGARNSNGLALFKTRRDRISPRQFSHTCEKLLEAARGDKCEVMNKFAPSQRNLKYLDSTPLT